MRLFKKALWAAGYVALLLSAAGRAQAGPLNLVQNGGFEAADMSSPSQMDGGNVDNWTTNGYNFIYFPGTAQTGSYTPEYNTLVRLWGPSLGARNGFPASSPGGGNFVAADGGFEVGAITQVIKGLVKGDQYAVSFYYAGAQQYGFSGATTEAWIVGLGTQKFETPILHDLSHGFTGWMRETLVFRATSSREVLSFLAVGTPNGQPPFSLLDDVTLTQFVVPEPGTWAVLGLGLGALCLTGRRRARRAALRAGA